MIPYVELKLSFLFSGGVIFLLSERRPRGASVRLSTRGKVWNRMPTSWPRLWKGLILTTCRFSFSKYSINICFGVGIFHFGHYYWILIQFYSFFNFNFMFHFQIQHLLFQQFQHFFARLPVN